jgi:carboxyl-terminal processing protease
MTSRPGKRSPNSGRKRIRELVRPARSDMNDSEQPGAFGPVHRAGSHRFRRDTTSAWMGNVIFFTGSLFGMGLMLLIVNLWPPEDDPDIAHYKEVRDLVMESYVEDVDRLTLVQSALRGMLDELGLYSRYYVEREVAEVTRETSGHFVGIGVVFRGGVAPEHIGQVLFPVADSPAAEAGLRVGDQILSIDGQSISGFSSGKFSELIQGLAGSAVELQVLGLDGTHRGLEVIRRDLLDPSVRRVTLIDPERKIGYLAIHSFSNETAREFDAGFARLKQEGMQALIVDLRGNQGGVLSAAVTIARRFIDRGEITATEGRGYPVREVADREEAKHLGFPLVVLVNDRSASSSEVLAGALQDHRVAVLIGEPTYGKGMVQTISRYPEYDAIAKVTSSFFYTPAHRNLERNVGGNAAHGLVPDLEVHLSDEEAVEILRYIRTIPPPPEALPALRSWELAEGIELIPDRPADPHLAAGLALFSGEFPPGIRTEPE